MLHDDVAGVARAQPSAVVAKMRLSTRMRASAPLPAPPPPPRSSKAEESVPRPRSPAIGRSYARGRAISRAKVTARRARGRGRTAHLLEALMSLQVQRTTCPGKRANQEGVGSRFAAGAGRMTRQAISRHCVPGKWMPRVVYALPVSMQKEGWCRWSWSWGSFQTAEFWLIMACETL